MQTTKPQFDRLFQRYKAAEEALLKSKLGFTLIAPITTAADDIHKYFFIVFLEKIRLDVSSESSARQRIHMKNQAIFSSKDKSKKVKCRLLQFLSGALMVKLYNFGMNFIF